MKDLGRLLWLGVGMLLGAAGVWLALGQTKTAEAASNDRFEDYILCTGSVAVSQRTPTDGVWLLDYRSGKLLGTVINRDTGKIGGWEEVDLVKDFGIAPKQNVHFLMTTGQITTGQAALYLAETSSGKFGVYTMAARPDRPGLMISKHDMVMFRQNPQK
jgi:hypothetical protein